MKPRVLLVANWDWVLYNFRLPLARALEDQGLDVILVCPPGKFTEKIQGEGFKWQAWDLRRQSLFPGREVVSIVKLWIIYQRLQPVTVHHITIKPILYGSIAALIGRKPTVINNFTGLGYLFSEAPKAIWLRTFLLPLLRWALNREDFHSVLLNEGDLDRLLSLNVISESNSTIIPSDGVDVELFRPSRRHKEKKQPPIVLMAGRLLRDKGVMEFLEAAQIINSEDVEARFWIAGKPDPGNPSSISDEIVEKYQEKEFIKFLGHRDDMPDLLQKVDIAVLPSYHEGVPVFLLEAAASGLPLVGTEIEGCRMVIDEGVNGHLVPKKNAIELAYAIKKMLLHPELREEMGQMSRAIAEDRFNKEKIVGEFIKLYKKLKIIPR